MSLSQKRKKSFQERKEDIRSKQSIFEAYALNCGFNSCPFLDSLFSVNRKIYRSSNSEMSVLEEEAERQQSVSMHEQIVHDAFDMMEMKYVVPDESVLERFGMHVVEMPSYSQA